jgi:hypothetical protein
MFYPRYRILKLFIPDPDPGGKKAPDPPKKRDEK